MIKAVKKFKFWPRKKRKKKTHPQPYYAPPPPLRPAPPPPPPPRHSHYSCSFSSSSSYYSTQPSAPPLPPWLEAEYTYETLLAPQLQPPPVPSQQEETALNTDANTSSPHYIHPTSTYQQYMVPDPVYGVPVAVGQTQTQTQTQTARARARARGTTRERPAAAAARVFGIVVDFGIRLFRCFCPCFHIREVL